MVTHIFGDFVRNFTNLTNSYFNRLKLKSEKKNEAKKVGIIHKCFLIILFMLSLILMKVLPKR